MEHAIKVDLLRLERAQALLGARRFGPFSLVLAAGERVAILGPSGAGKSTLLKLLARELPLADGRAWLDGRALEHWTVSDLSRRRAVLPQSATVAFGLRADLVIGLGRVARAEDPLLDETVRQAAALAHAAHLLGRSFDTLSGGESARVQLARVFAQLWEVRGGLILVDEPLAALDPGLQFDLLDSLERFAAERGHALVAILHDINHALQGFERLLLVKDGRLLHDVASDAAALPLLEELYGIVLGSVRDAQGALVVTPLRQIGRARVAV